MKFYKYKENNNQVIVSYLQTSIITLKQILLHDEKEFVK